MRERGLGPLAVLAVLAAVFLSFAASPAQARYAAFVMDADTGKILHQVNPDTQNYPASLTKMMTLYMLFDALDRGKIKESDTLKVSARAARQPSSRLGLGRGSAITVHDAILALVTKSANDVAVVVGETLGLGSERRFAEQMTAKAHAIGMKNTVFRNASGLYSRAQLSTARDMAILARRLIKDFPHYYKVFATETFEYGGETHKNHNALMTTYDGMDGIKTGYIGASGFNLVASAKRNGKRVIGVVFGGKTARARNAHMANLLDKGFSTLGVSVAADGKKHDTSDLVAESDDTPSAQDDETPAPTPVAAGKDDAVTPSGDYGIQVGAFAQYDPAYQAANRALARAPGQLSDGVIKIAPLPRARKGPLYRAQIVGITKAEAFRACSVIKKDKFAGCMAFKLKTPDQVADAGS